MESTDQHKSPQWFKVGKLRWFWSSMLDKCAAILKWKWQYVTEGLASSSISTFPVSQSGPGCLPQGQAHTRARQSRCQPVCVSLNCQTAPAVAGCQHCTPHVDIFCSRGKNATLWKCITLPKYPTRLDTSCATLKHLKQNLLGEVKTNSGRCSCGCTISFLYGTL